MDFIRLAQILLRRWWLVVLFSVAGVCCAYVLAANAPKRYLSTVSLQLNPAARSSFLPYGADANISGSSPVVAQAASYNEVLRSRSFGQVIAQQLNLPLAPETIASVITTQLVPNTNIMRLMVTWDNPVDAQQLAQRIAEIFIAENQRRQQAQPGTQAHLADMEQSARDIQARLGPLQQQRDRLDEAVARGDLSRLNELTGLDSRLTTLQSSYANLLIEISRVRGSFDTAVILDTASQAQSLDTLPLVQALVFGLLGGIGVAIGVLVLAEWIADAVRTPTDIAAVAGVAPIGRLGHTRTWHWRRLRRDKGLVLLEQPFSRVAEDFRSLRANLRLSDTPRAWRTLVVTSPAAGDGKTFVAANLAITLAQAGTRVLLVDADLRRPTLHTWFRLPPSRGLAEALREGTINGVLASGVENLSVMPAGDPPPNPGDLLGSAAVGTFVERVVERFDVVVFDSAPTSLVADTLSLATHVSASVVVARCGRTRRARLLDSLSAFGRIGRPVVGVVLNDERGGPLARLSSDDYPADYVRLAPTPEHANGADQSRPPQRRRIRAARDPARERARGGETDR